MISNSRILHINSDDRISGTASNFTWSYKKSGDEVYDRVCLLSASIPLSYYLIQDGYNTFQLRENVTTVTITVPAGNYNTTSFATTVSALLTASSPTSFVYAISMNNIFTTVNTGKFRFTVTNNAGVQPSFIFGSSSLNEQFGFSSNSTVTFSASVLNSTNVCSFIPEQTLFIHSDLVKTDKNNSDGILQELYTSNTTPYSCITYQATAVEAYSKEIKNNKTNTFSIILQNENNEPIQLNGRNMNITIILYKSNDFYDYIKKFIKYSLLSEN